MFIYILNKLTVVRSSSWYINKLFKHDLNNNYIISLIDYINETNTDNPIIENKLYDLNFLFTTYNNISKVNDLSHNISLNFHSDINELYNYNLYHDIINTIINSYKNHKIELFIYMSNAELNIQDIHQNKLLYKNLTIDAVEQILNISCEHTKMLKQFSNRKIRLQNNEINNSKYIFQELIDNNYYENCNNTINKDDDTFSINSNNNALLQEFEHYYKPQPSKKITNNKLIGNYENINNNYEFISNDINSTNDILYGYEKYFNYNNKDIILNNVKKTDDNVYLLFYHYYNKQVETTTINYSIIKNNMELIDKVLNLFINNHIVVLYDTNFFYDNFCNDKCAEYEDITCLINHLFYYKKINDIDFDYSFNNNYYANLVFFLKNNFYFKNDKKYKMKFSVFYDKVYSLLNNKNILNEEQKYKLKYDIYDIIKNKFELNKICLPDGIYWYGIVSKNEVSNNKFIY